MPTVGGKHYAYTAAGRAAAKRESKRIGKPITDKRKAFGPEQFREKAEGYENREDYISLAKKAAKAVLLPGLLPSAILSPPKSFAKAVRKAVLPVLLPGMSAPKAARKASPRKRRKVSPLKAYKPPTSRD